MAKKTVRGRYLRWGHSYGIRLRKKDAERLKVRPGTDVKVTLESEAEPLKPDDMMVVDGAAGDSLDHDRILAEGPRQRERN